MRENRTSGSVRGAPGNRRSYRASRVHNHAMEIDIMTGNQVIRLLFSVLLIPIGAVMILLAAKGTAGILISNLGLAFIVTGVVSTFHEGVIRRLENSEAACAVANKVHDKLKEAPLSATGIKLVSSVRKGYSGYYQWALNNGTEEIFFAGRSVLHRIDADFRERSIGTAESLIARRLSEGASFKIMFVNPLSGLIHRLAEEEGQTENQLLSDVAISLGICQRLHKIIKSDKLPIDANLDIRVFDEIPYFAYHRVADHVIIGFYFSSLLGHASAAYEVVDRQTKEFFGEHFLSIFGRASNEYLLKIDQHSRNPKLNIKLINQLRERLIEKIGDEKTNELMGEKKV